MKGLSFAAVLSLFEIMIRTSQEQLKNKFSLVYEYNRQSPLFVRAAEGEIDNNNFHTAVDILREGLKSFPDYPTAHIMLGKAYTRLGEYEKAEDEFVIGSELINSKKTLSYYINELEKTKRVDLLFISSKRVPFIPENFERVISDQDEEHNDAIEVNANQIETEIGGSDKETGEPEAKLQLSDLPLEERLEDLAKELSTSKFAVSQGEQSVEPALNTNKDDQIVTETLAKILLSQGKFKEAISVYEKLILKTPEKTHYYKDKIIEIRSQIDGMDW